MLAVLAPRAASAQGATASINGERLYYEVAGEGVPVVLIHGWTLNLRMWDPQVPALSRHARVIRYDRRGFGKSSGNEDVSWDAVDLAALLDSLGVRQAHVVGMSQGARVALQFAHLYPERVLSVVLQGVPPPDGFGLTWSGADRPRFDDWATLVRDRGMDEFRREWAAHPLMAIPAGHGDARARLADLLAAYRGSRFVSPAPPSGPVRSFAMSDVQQIRAPTLVIVSNGEVPFLQIVGRSLAYYLPNARLVAVPGGGHMLNLIEPERYSQALLQFLAKTP